MIISDDYWKEKCALLKGLGSCLRSGVCQNLFSEWLSSITIQYNTVQRSLVSLFPSSLTFCLFICLFWISCVTICLLFLEPFNLGYAWNSCKRQKAWETVATYKVSNSELSFFPILMLYVYYLCFPQNPLRKISERRNQN